MLAPTNGDPWMTPTDRGGRAGSCRSQSQERRHPIGEAMPLIASDDAETAGGENGDASQRDERKPDEHDRQRLSPGLGELSGLSGRLGNDRDPGDGRLSKRDVACAQEGVDTDGEGSRSDLR